MERSVPCSDAASSKQPPLKTASPKKPDGFARKPNCFLMGLYAMPPYVGLGRPRPALT
jgi:hypothetical protein